MRTASSDMRKPTLILIAQVLLLLIPAVSSLADEGRRLITAADLEPLYRETIREKAPWPQDSMEISGVKAYPPRLWVPEGQISYEVSRIASQRFLGRVAIEISVRVDDIPARSVRVCGRVEAFRDVLCAARDLRRGDIINASCLTTARMPISKIRNQILDTPAALIGMAVRHAVRAGQPLSSNAVAPPVLVKRGSKVIILAQSPTLTIRVPGKAVEQGAHGDFIRVRNLQSKKEILAQVRDSRTVTVMF